MDQKEMIEQFEKITEIVEQLQKEFKDEHLILRSKMNTLEEKVIVLEYQLKQKMISAATGENGAFIAEDEEFDLKKIEKKVVQRALKATKRNKTRAAKLLGVTRGELVEKMERYKLNMEGD